MVCAHYFPCDILIADNPLCSYRQMPQLPVAILALPFSISAVWLAVLVLAKPALYYLPFSSPTFRPFAYATIVHRVAFSSRRTKSA